MTRVALPRPPAPISRDEIVGIRWRLNCSQSVFAMMLNVSPRTVQAWEQGTREPSDAALKLLSMLVTRLRENGFVTPPRGDLSSPRPFDLTPVRSG